MAKREKSNKLFAILAIPLDIQRDISLSELVGGDHVEYIDKRYVASGGYGSQLDGTFFSKNFNGIRKWKTEAGCTNYKNMLEKSGKTYGDAPYELFDVDYKCSAFSTILRCPT